MMVNKGKIVALISVCWFAVVKEATSTNGVPFAEISDSNSDENTEFSAYRSQPIHFSHNSHEALLFDGIHRNNGGHYDLTNGYFQAPIKGLYVFNVTTYITMENRLRLMKNDYEVRMVRKDGKSNSRRSTNENILLQLDANDRVWIRVAHTKRHRTHENNSTVTRFSGQFITDDVNIDVSQPRSSRHRRSTSSSVERVIRESNFAPVSLVPTGSLMHEVENYDVTPTAQKIAFSVSCTKSMIGGHMADTTLSMNGPMSPEAAPNGRIGFDKTFVNIGNGFNMTKNAFIAPTSGVYYFSYNVGKFPKKKLSVMLMKNFNEIQSIIYSDSRNKAREMQSQSLMLNLKKGETIWLRSYNNKDYGVYSNYGNYITFNGYLVFVL